jgi:dipeptidase E
MKLMLTSFAHLTLDYLDKICGQDYTKMKVAFIPTAADPYLDKGFILLDRKKLIDMGFSVDDIDIKEYQEDDLAKVLSDYDIYFVAGGNAYYLLEQVIKTGFAKIIKKQLNRGKIFIGSSAGSILTCPTVDAARLFDPVSEAKNLTTFEGMGLVDFIVLPHFGKPKYMERIRQTIETWSAKGYHIYPLTDNQAILIDQDKILLIDASVDI